MEYRVFESDVVLRVEKGEEIVSAILEVAKKENISLASITGIGASNLFEVGVLNLETKQFKGITYEGTYEIASLVGNLTTKDGSPYLHLHATFGSLDKMVAGHLTKAYVSATAEIIIHIINGTVERKFDANIGLNLFKF